MNPNNRSRRRATEYVKTHPKASVAEVSREAKVSRVLARSVLQGKPVGKEKPKAAAKVPEEAKPEVEAPAREAEGSKFEETFPSDDKPAQPVPESGRPKRFILRW